MAEVKRAEPTVANDKNAQSEQDVKDMLSELKAEKLAKAAKIAETNGNAQNNPDTRPNGPEGTVKAVNDDSALPTTTEDEPVGKNTEVGGGNGDGAEEKSEKSDRADRRDQERSSRGRGRGGHRGNSRGGGFTKSKDHKQNIKSDLVSKEESNDPVAIRKQVIMVV